MAKHDLWDCEDHLTRGDVCVFKDGSIKKVDRYDKSKHLITFNGERPKDFWVIFDNIEQIYFEDYDGEASEIHIANAVLNAIRFINHLTKYKAYLTTIKDYLHGNKESYIYELCHEYEYFGEYKYIDDEKLMKVINNSIEFKLIKPRKSKRGKTYYTVRLDGKRWRKI